MAADLPNKEEPHCAPPLLPVVVGPRPSRLFLRLCALFVAVTGGIALLGWILGLPFLSSLGSGNIPVAPSTALLFVLYGVALALRSRPPQRGAYWAGLAITSAGAVVALLLLILSWQGIYLEAEHPGLTIMHPAGQTIIGHMSPATAFCFLLASLSFLASGTKHPRLTTAAGLLAALLAGSGFVFVLAYVYGAPLLYGSAYIPPAALTSMAFLFLGSGLLTLSLPPGWLARLQAESPPRVLAALILIFFFLATSIVVAGFRTYRSYEQNHRTEVERQLWAIAELKANELAHYRKERAEDACLLSQNTSFAALVRRHLENPEDQANGQELLEWLEKLRAHAQYDQVRLLDPNGITRLSAPAGAMPLSAITARRLPVVLTSGQAAIQDFYRNDHSGKIYLVVLAPILDPQNGNRPLGLLSLRIDPEQYLYPFLQRWPIPSRTGETLLIRREGQEVVFLNKLRFQKDTALALRFPLTQTDLPAARAVLGQTGVAEGLDYRGMPVIADVRPIPDSPWFLVSKMDTSEAYTPLKEHLWIMGGFVAALLLGVGAIMAFAWQRQRVAFFRERLETAAELKNLNRIYAVLSNINQTIVRVRDPQELFRAACRIAVEDGGFRLAWIGMLDKASGVVSQTASAGLDDGYLAKLRITLENAPSDQGPTESALREGRYSVVNDIEHEARTAPWRIEALRCGYRSSAAFPLFVFDEIRGVISFYAGEPFFFNTDEIRLLDELAHDISFAMEFAEQEESRRKAEAALRESQQLFATVANTSPALIWMSGLDKGCTWFNEPWLAFTGRSLEEERGDGWTAGVHADDLGHCLKIYTEAFEARQPFAMEYRLRRHDGEYRWLLDQGQPRYDASGAFAGFIGSCLDLTEHRSLEKQMRHAVKMESIGTLAGGVAHDFNNILMAIIGYGQLALMGMPENDPQRLNIKSMLEGADRAARLTKDLLLFSRKQISERKPVDLLGIINTVEKFIARVIGEDIVCETRLPDEPLIVLADSHQLEQVLMNLATNARDAMPKGGTFSITAEQTILHRDFIAAHGFGRPGPYALLTVSDSGCGMDEQTRNRIFDPFFTTKGVGKGTGLGLAVVYGIIKQHEGYINVYSEPDRGATFRLYLPLTVAETVEETGAPEEEAPAQGTETILIAEDDESLRTLAGAALTRFGYTVIEAVDGEEAVRKFKENQAAIQLLLFDIVMPKMNGQEAYEAINKIQPGIKTIFMSGYAPEMIREKAALKESTPLLAKPLSPTELLQKVREILDQ
ncbi:MAG TPA: ATP-binding protein [Desulfurivibrionaceae bacterium]